MGGGICHFMVTTTMVARLDRTHRPLPENCKETDRLEQTKSERYTLIKNFEEKRAEENDPWKNHPDPC